MIEPFPSLLQRELAILSRDYGRVSRSCWEMSRVLLRLRNDSATLAGMEEDVSGKSPPSKAADPDQPSLDFGSGSEEDYD